MNGYRKTFKCFSAFVAVSLVCGCNGQFAFDNVDNSFVSRPTKPVYTSEQVRDEIALFNQELQEQKPTRLNTEFVPKGLLALAGRDYLKANKNFQRALKFEPQNSSLHMLNGLSHQLRAEAGDPEQFKMAEVGYGLAARMDPGDSKLPYFMGVIQFKQQRYRLAQEHFASAVALDPKKPEYLIGLAASSYYLGELDRAFTNANRALLLAPMNSAALQTGGVIYASIGAFDLADENATRLGDVSAVRKQYLQRRIAEWKNYYNQEDIKNDPVIQVQLAQNLDAFGIPRGGMFDPTGTSQNDPMSRGDKDALPSDSAAPVSPVQTTPLSPATTIKITPAAKTKTAKTALLPPRAAEPTKKMAPKVVMPKMALIDVAIIRTEEIFKASKGVNLLSGLNLFFSSDQIFQTKTPFGLGRVRTPLTTNDTLTLKLGTAGAGLTYSLNIFSSNYDRNEVIARPTILVEDKKKSSFFSGDTLHIVLEGGAAGSGSMQDINTGVKLEVTPKFLDAETLDLNVYAQRAFLEASLAQVSDNITGTSFAKTTKTTISANLTLRYNETMILSGLSDQEKEILDDKVPGLGDVPGVQYLFRQQTKTLSKKTILILLTPRKAGLSYRSGDLMVSNAELDNSKVKKLEKSSSWMRPASNLSAFVRHLGKYEFFNHYRIGDMQLDTWAGEGSVNNAIIRALEFLYIYYEFEKSSESSL